jgi:N-acetylglucosaminyl-diphospho-decaprenol L-rhamnosyltransferase
MGIPRVCAIILDYFGADKTEACLRSLIGQGIETIYLVDNSAAESASAALRSVIGHVNATADYKIKIITAGENLGFAKGVNFALCYDAHAESPHDYYLLLNNDAVAGPSLVHGLIQAIDHDPGVALVAPRIVSSDPNREYGIWYHRYLGLLLSRPGRFRFHYFTGCCLLFPRHLVSEAGLFDEDFFMYGEDTELGWRLMRERKNTLCAQDVYVEHEYGSSVDRSSFFYEYHMERGHFLVCLKTYVHPMEIPFLVIIKSAAMATRSISRALRHQTFAPLRALCCGWFRLKNIAFPRKGTLHKS